MNEANATKFNNAETLLTVPSVLWWPICGNRLINITFNQSVQISDELVIRSNNCCFIMELASCEFKLPTERHQQ